MHTRRMHPLAGGFATMGGLLAGLGLGLAIENPAAGLLFGLGLGMIITAALRAFGRWRWPVGGNGATRGEQ